MQYTPKHARFESVDFQAFASNVSSAKRGQCKLCIINKNLSLETSPRVIGKDAFRFKGVSYKVGDAVFLAPSSYKMRNRHCRKKMFTPSKSVDESVHTEFYRKRGTKVKGV